MTRGSDYYLPCRTVPASPWIWKLTTYHAGRCDNAPRLHYLFCIMFASGPNLSVKARGGFDSGNAKDNAFTLFKHLLFYSRAWTHVVSKHGHMRVCACLLTTRASSVACVRALLSRLSCSALGDQIATCKDTHTHTLSDQSLTCQGT